MGLGQNGGDQDSAVVGVGFMCGQGNTRAIHIFDGTTKNVSRDLPGDRDPRVYNTESVEPGGPIPNSTGNIVFGRGNRRAKGDATGEIHSFD